MWKGIKIFSWALYDLANQFFLLNIVSLHFGIWIVVEKGMPEFFYSLSYTLSIVFVAIGSIIWGVASDISFRRRVYLVFFTMLSVVFTALLGFFNDPWIALLFFAIANFGCQIAMVFYNAYLPYLVRPERMGLVSGIGRMLGYSGAILGLFILEPLVEVKKYDEIFIYSSILFLIFSLPCMLLMKDEKADFRKGMFLSFNLVNLSEIYARLKAILFYGERSRALRDFLKSIFCSLCVINTLILYMSLYLTRVFQMSENEKINIVAIATVFAIAGSIVWGYLSDILGYKKSLCLIYFLWLLGIFWAVFIPEEYSVQQIGGVVGFSLGGIWTVSRAIIARLVSKRNITEVFALFGLISYISSGVGVILWAVLINFYGLWEISEESIYRMTLLSFSIWMFLSIIFIVRLPRLRQV